MTITRKALIEQVRRGYPADHSLYLNFGGCRVALHANRADMIDALKAYFKPFLSSDGQAEIHITAHEAPAIETGCAFTAKEPDPGKTRIKEEYVDLPDGRLVRKRLTGMLFAFGSGENMAMGPCMANLNQVVNFVNNRHIEWALCRGCLLGHAAGVVHEGRGLALAGFSGAGKSTLALNIMNHGAVFVSNDRLMIEKSGNGLWMYGVAKLPRINPGTILNNPSLAGLISEEEEELFSGMAKEDLWKLEHKYDAPIDACFGPDRFALDSRMHALVILNWRHDAGRPRVRKVNPAERTDLLPAFMKSTGLFFSPHRECGMPEPCEENYVDFLSRCDMLEFTGGIDFEHAAQTCIDYLKRGGLDG